MIEQSKKLVNKLVKTSATVALVGVTTLNGLVKAEENTEVKPQEAPKPTEETTKKEPETLAEAQALVAVATTEEAAAEAAVATETAGVAAQEAVVATAATEEGAAAKAEAAAEAELAEAQAIAAEATPEKIEETTQALEVKTAEKTTAETDLTAVQNAVEAQSAELATAEAAVVTAQAAVDAATAEIAAAEAGIKDPEALAAQKATAEARVAKLEADIVAAQANLTTVSAEAANAVTLSILQKQAEITRLTAEIEKLNNQISMVTQPVDVTNGNTFVLPSTFPSAVIKELIVASQTRYTGGAANFNAVLSRANAAIAAQAADGMALNTYKASTADNRTVDPANLDTATQNELASFAAAMLNQARQQLGLTQVEVVAGAQDFAKRLARHITSLGTLPAGYHDFAAISATAQAVGLTSGDTFAYESLGMSGGQARTVNDLKSGIYTTLKMMIFEDHRWSNDLGHTLNLLRNDSPRIYMGVGVSTASSGFGNYNQHIIMVASNNVRQGGGFNSTAITSGRTVSVQTDNSAQIAALRTRIANLQSEIKTLQAYQTNPSTNPTVATAAQRVASLRNDLSAAKTTLATVTSQLANVTSTNATNTARLTEAKNRLAAATPGLTAAKATLATEKTESEALAKALATAKEKVASLTADVTALTTLLAKYNQPNLVAEKTAALEAAKLAHEKAAKAVATETDKLATLNKSLAEARAILAEKEAALAAAQAILAKFLPTVVTTPVTSSSVGRVLVDPVTGVRVGVQAGEDKIVGIRVSHKETNAATTPAILNGKDYDLFDIETVDAAGNFVQINKPATVTLPVDPGKRVAAVIYLPNANSQQVLPVTETVMVDQNGNVVNAVVFTAQHFSEYAIVYAGTGQVSQATNQVLVQKSAAPAGATTTAKVLPNTGDKASLVASVLGTMLVSGATLMGTKRKED